MAASGGVVGAVVTETILGRGCRWSRPIRASDRSVTCRPVRAQGEGSLGQAPWGYIEVGRQILSMRDDFEAASDGAIRTKSL